MSLFSLLSLWMNSATSAAVVCATKSTPPETWMPYCPPRSSRGVMVSAV